MITNTNRNSSKTHDYDSYHVNYIPQFNVYNLKTIIKLLKR